MGTNLVRMLFATGFWLCGITAAAAQDNYHQLTVNDFRGTPQSSDAIAYTHCTIDYRYHVIGKDNFYNLTFNVQVILDRELSWLDRRRVQSKQMLADILKHEQGHYTIAYMEQQEILREASRTRFDANYQAEATALFNRIHDKYEQLNLNYDDDTKHMLDGVQQHSWDVYFKKRLAYMPPTELAKN